MMITGCLSVSKKPQPSIDGHSAADDLQWAPKQRRLGRLDVASQAIGKTLAVRIIEMKRSQLRRAVAPDPEKHMEIGSGKSLIWPSSLW